MNEGYRPEWIALEQALGGRPEPSADKEVDIVAYNEMSKALAAQWPKEDDLLEVVSQTMEPYHMKAGIYKPTNAISDLPVMIYFHGGGYMAGSIETEDPHCRIFASKTPCVVFNVEYPLASDGNNLDTIIDAGVNAVTWACENAAQYGADATKGCLVAGSSAGAALALQVTYSFITKGNCSPVTGILLHFPFAADSTYNGKYKELHTSYQENAKGVPIINLMAFDRILANVNASRTSALHLPLLAPDNLLARLPPSYIAVAEKDPVRDDGVVLQKRLTDVGVPAKLQYYSGLPHHFHVFSALDIAHEMMADSVEGARWVLAVGEGRSV